MLKAKLDHLNMTVKSVKESESFYLKVFGLEKVEEGVTPNDRKWAILSNGELSLCIYEEDREDPELNERFHNMYHFAIRLPEKSQEKFIKIKNELNLKHSSPSPVSYPHSDSWYVYDPSGYHIEVVFWKGDKLKF